MSRALACCVLLFCATANDEFAAPPGQAGPPPFPPPAPPIPTDNPEDRQKQEAMTYAQAVLGVAMQVEEQYVRLVSRADLLHAALTGLYDAAREPAPGGLRVDLKRAADGGSQLNLLRRARESLGDAEPLRGPEAALASCRAMVRLLDPHSAVLSGEELRRSRRGDENFGAGLDLADNPGVGPLRVKAVLLGGPAQKAGLRPDDEITHIDGKPAAGTDHRGALAALNGGAMRPAEAPPDALLFSEAVELKPVELTVRRGGTTHTFTLPRRQFQVETVLGVARRPDDSWDYLLDRRHKVAHVRLASLARGTSAELLRVLAALEKQEVGGMVLDLRWCPGGYLDEALNVARLFVGDVTVATVKGRTDGEREYRGAPGHKPADFPLVVLVNDETSGGAELIAAALQDHRRARVAGQRTRGKASVQHTVALPVPGSELRLTTGTFLRPSGKNLHRFPDARPGDDWGVRPEPDLEVRVSAELGKRLRQWWQEQDLRTGSSNVALPLDRADADPQRRAALDAVLGMMDK